MMLVAKALTYHGILAPASPLRDHVVPRPPSLSLCAAETTSGMGRTARALPLAPLVALLRDAGRAVSFPAAR